MNAPLARRATAFTLRPDLAAFFALERRSSASRAKPSAPLVGVLAELAERGHL